MSIQWIQLGAGIILAVVISLAAWKARSLSRSGAAAAAVLGTIVFGLGGLPWAILLMAFFITSSGLSHFSKKRKAALYEKFSKGSERDAWQVLANGGISGLFVLLHLVYPQAVFPWIGFAGALAAANADTWATEIGVLSRSGAVMITNGKPVERGTSGGVSLLGTAAAFGGSFFIGLLAALFAGQVIHLPGSWETALWVGAGVALIGLFGSLVDSTLGATVQAVYHCPTCDKETERHPVHLCGSPTTLIRGLTWLDNDWVNIGCTLTGGLLGVILGIQIL